MFRRSPWGYGAFVFSLTAVAVGFLIASRQPAAAAGCQPPGGGKVQLMSDAADPDVFLWDSRQRLIDYTAGQWGDAKAIFAHTLLAGPGTGAVVVSCVPGAAHPRFAGSERDAVGVRITSGPYKGHFGWVLSSDIHPMPGAAGRYSSVVGTPTTTAR